MPRSPKAMPEKPCEICGLPMQRKRFGAALEDCSAFLRRRFCSLSCANSREKGGTSSTTFHRRASNQRKTACESCGKPHYRLHVHHLDLNPANNAPANLQTLCPSCHKLLHEKLRQRGLSPTPLRKADPAEWDACAGTETQSSRKSRRSSSARTGSAVHD